MNAKSKNEIKAKEELADKMERLQRGIIPKEYKDVI
jgi:hypothetical protein